MKKSRFLGAIFACLIAFLSMSTDAALYSFEWSFSGGEPLIQGVVDTQQDLLRIAHWSDQDLTSTSNYSVRTPDLTNTSVFPDNEWHMYAYQANGNIYDIPDNWGGDIGSDWGFISSIHVNIIPWNEGSARPFKPGNMMEFVYTGFGAWKYGYYGTTGPSYGGNSVGTTGANGGGAMLNGVILNNEDGHIYQASGRLNVQAIPIPPALWLFGSGLLGLFGIAKRKGSAYANITGIS